MKRKLDEESLRKIGEHVRKHKNDKPRRAYLNKKRREDSQNERHD